MKKVLIGIMCLIVLFMCYSCAEKEFEPSNGEASIEDDKYPITLSLNKDSVSIKKGSSSTITLKYTGVEKLSDIEYSVKSLNTKIATVEKTDNGAKITGVAAGTTTVTISSEYGSGEVDVEVTNNTVLLNSNNWKTYCKLSGSISGSTVTLKVSPTNQKYNLSFSGTAYIYVLVTYEYYMTGFTNSLTTGYKYLSISVSISSNNNPISKNIENDIKRECPGTKMKSYRISSGTLEYAITNILGSIEY